MNNFDETTKKTIEDLMADPRLTQLCDIQRTGEEILNVIKLSENQHSNILAWMFDPREGHGQGEEILKDFLIHASIAAKCNDSYLDGRSTTSRFFKIWTPSKIRTTGFGSAFTARELGIKATERVDLFVIDPQNKFIIAIENKAGSKHTQNQLERYKEHLTKLVFQNSRLSDYALVYIALDRDASDEYFEDAPASNYWLHMSYSWLNCSARRALLHVNRGNAAAKIVMSYCNRQTDWEDPDNALCTRLCAELHHSYSETINLLIEVNQGRAEKNWLLSKTDDTVLLFALQNKSAVGLLKETKGMASVKSEIIHKLKFLPEHISSKRTRLYILPACVESFRGSNWPIYITVKYSEGSTSKYSITLTWNAEYASSESHAEELRTALISIEPNFEKNSASRARRVSLADTVSLQEAVEVIEKITKYIQRAVSQIIV
jgi:hypothetical protein